MARMSLRQKNSWSLRTTRKNTSDLSFILIIIALIIVFGFVSLSCATSPRGRKQLMLVPESQMTSMGVQAFSEMKAKLPIEKDTDINSYVECVARPLTALGTDIAPRGEWEIVVFDDKSANAFALPGGKIGVYTGMLNVAQSQSQLATVIGHEIGHVIAKHGNERVSETLVAQGGLAVLSSAINTGGANHDLLLGALGLGAQIGVLLPHSRTQESEADLIGLELMAKAGFDPNQSVELWKNMTQTGSRQPPEFLSTHPSHATRIENLRASIPSVMPYYQQVKSHPKCVPPEGKSRTRKASSK